MFKEFRNLFGNKPARATGTSGTDDDVFNDLRWIEASDNPFGIRVLDCRSVALGLTSTTGDMAVAQRFLELRSSLGTEYLGQMPSNAIEAECDLNYPSGGGHSSDGPLFIAGEMEDKWNIYLHAGCLYFARSWTGILVSRARLKLVGAFAYVDRIDVDRHTADDPDVAIGHVDYLIKSHIFDKIAPHPVPKKVDPIEREIALYSFSLYGRRGQFASYEDTTRVEVFS